MAKLHRSDITLSDGNTYSVTYENIDETLMDCATVLLDIEDAHKQNEAPIIIHPPHCKHLGS